MRQALIVTMLLGVLALIAAVAIPGAPDTGVQTVVAASEPAPAATPFAGTARVTPAVLGRSPYAGAIGSGLSWLTDAVHQLKAENHGKGDANAWGHSASPMSRTASGFVVGTGDRLMGAPNAATLASKATTIADRQAGAPVVWDYGRGTSARSFATAMGETEQPASDDDAIATDLAAAAEAGNAEAQLALGERYLAGQGVTVNRVAAYLWFAIAASSPQDEPARDRAAEKRDLVAAMLSPAERSAADDLVVQWRPKVLALAAQ